MNTDLVTMIANISKSLIPVQTVISGMGYLLGLVMIIIALVKFKSVSSKGSSEEGLFVPIAFLFGGGMLIYLPSTLSVLSNTTFGTTSILQYTNYNPYDVYGSMKIMIQTAGLIWFVRGTSLLIHSSEPGKQHGPKGLAFLSAGILAINFESTIGAVNFAVYGLMHHSWK